LDCRAQTGHSRPSLCRLAMPPMSELGLSNDAAAGRRTRGEDVVLPAIVVPHSLHICALNGLRMSFSNCNRLWTGVEAEKMSPPDGRRIREDEKELEQGTQHLSVHPSRSHPFDFARITVNSLCVLLCVCVCEYLCESFE